MADLGNISQVTLPNGDIAYFKDSTAISRLDNFALKDVHPEMSKTYTNVYCSANSDPAGWLYFGTIRPVSFQAQWSISYRVRSVIAGRTDGFQVSDVYISATRDAYTAYRTWNEISSTSYRPVYAYTMYRCKEAGYNAGYGPVLGIRFQSSWNCTVADNARTIDIEILELTNCTFSFYDSMILYADVPGTGSTNYGTRDSFDATTQGNTMSGDKNTYDRTFVYGASIKANSAITTTSVIVGNGDGLYQNLKSGLDFDISYPILYTSAAIAANANSNSNTYLTMPFAIANTQQMTLVFPKSIWIQGTLSGTTFRPVSTAPLTQDIPETDDGYQYIYLGQAYSATSMYLMPEHPIFEFSNGSWHQVVNYAQDSGTVDGHTVEADVPSDAVFTDTTYSLASSGGQGLSLTPDGGSPVYTKVNTQDLVRPASMRGSYDVTLNGQINTNRANRLAFLPADQIIIEKTVDGGLTWTDAGVSDQQKRALFAEVRPGIPLPRINDLPNVLCGIRITITAMKYDVPANTPETQKYNYWNSDHVLSQERYVSLREMYFWVSATNNSMGVKVEKATGANSTNWQTIFNDPSFYMTGWSGPDYISFVLSTFGGGTTQTTNFWNYRITLMTKGANGSSTEYGSSTYAQTVMEVRGYGESAWSGNSYAMYDHLYSKDENMNATFPGTVTATNFNGKINNHTVEADVPSNAVFTDTTDLSQMTGTLGFAHGGTGQTSGVDAANSLLNQLTTGSSVPHDADYYISQYVGGGTTTTTYHRRPMSAMWTWIESKIDAAYTNALTKYAGSDSAGGPANKVKGVAATTNAYRHVWFSDGTAEDNRNYDDDFKYNPSTNDIKLSAAHMRYDATTKSIMFEFD